MILQKWRLKLTPFPHLKRNAFLNTVIDLALMLLMEHCSFIYCIIKITEVTHSPLFHIKGWIKGVKLILNIHTHTHTHFFFHVCAVLYSKSSKSFSDVIFSCLENSSLIKFLHSCLAENIEKAILISDYIIKVTY